MGAAIASRLSAAGARVTVTDIRYDPLEEIANDLGQAQAIAIDVTDETAVETGLETAKEGFGPVDVLVNNAGTAVSAPLVKTTFDAWRAVLEVNLTGVFLMSRAVLPGMLERGRGRIVNIASTAGLKGYAYVGPYCAAKHGVVGLTRSLALEVGRRGITVNAVCPGYTDTELLDRSIANIVEKTGVSEGEARVQLLAVNPQGRFVQPEEVAETVAWIVGPNSEAINGQAIAVAGGEVM
jgi:NAD(P)-dependent dehydrogenase (short-subunit alcohol dehydrogenase family)